ncbi:MAG: hypothetical protein K6C94_03045 [Candidatus Gastranaerophilales bacterium]|nr:hypothetical protein [Candidatus Gastranaerophilales bacterium]
MLSFLFGKKDSLKKVEIDPQSKELSDFLIKLKEIYRGNDISEGRKAYLRRVIEKYGYLPYPHIRALEELNAADTIFGLEVKWRLNGVLENSQFKFNKGEISPVSRAGITNSEWMKREQHKIKLINLTALGNGNYSPAPGNFVDWLKQILILPSGNLEKNILGTTIYLVPFHPRDFGCAYLPSSSEVGNSVKDDYLTGKLGITAEKQVQLFITLAQLAGHPVIYDILPQTSRFAKEVLANPSIVRWMDVNQLMESLDNEIDKISPTLVTKYGDDDAKIVIRLAKETLRCGSDDMSEHYSAIFEEVCEKLKPKKKYYSDKMTEKGEQIKLVKRVKEIISKSENKTYDEIKGESDITQQGNDISALIREGLWPVSGGAWCSAGVPVFDKMSETGDYPTFKHYNYKGEDVSRFANLDCQAPFYFVYLESGEYNQPVVNYFIEKVKNLCKTYHFDGIRFDHIDHVVDEVSQKGDRPISYRAPKHVLAKCNEALKQECKHFAILAEYMLGGNYIKEYHRDMHFDILWGNDIICQHQKTPYEIIKNNQDLKAYNEAPLTRGSASVLKTYNNQDGEFRDINQYPGQLGRAGALFKWFKMNFIPGGKKAQRPILYVDGDESFTTVGTEACIGAEISMKREKDYDFYEKFDAIARFAKNNDLLADGEAQIITQADNGFACWAVTKHQSKEILFVAANYLAPTEKVFSQLTHECEIHEGASLYDASIEVPKEYTEAFEYVYNYETKDFEERKVENFANNFFFERLEPSEFKFYKLVK